MVLLAKLQATKGDAQTNLERLRLWIDEQAFRENRETAAGDLGAINLFECDSEQAWDQLLAGILGLPYDAAIDALFGTGLTRPIEGIHKEAVKYLRRLHQMRDSSEGSHTPIISVDVPSGLDSDSRELIGETVHADSTVTMTFSSRVQESSVQFMDPVHTDDPSRTTNLWCMRSGTPGMALAGTASDSTSGESVRGGGGTGMGRSWSTL